MPDIVDVDLIGADRQCTTIRLPWRDGEDGDTNAAMTASTDRERDLFCLTVE